MNLWIILAGDLIFLALMYLSRRAAQKDYLALYSLVTHGHTTSHAESIAMRNLLTTAIAELPRRRPKKQEISS